MRHYLFLVKNKLLCTIIVVVDLLQNPDCHIGDNKLWATVEVTVLHLGPVVKVCDSISGMCRGILLFCEHSKENLYDGGK